jgi:CheY-like chemotaxis protein
MSLIREEVEHAYNSTRRLRLRLSALSRLAVEHARNNDRATRIAAEARGALDAQACSFHQISKDKKCELLALTKPEEIDAVKLERLAARLVQNVIAAGEAIALTKLELRSAGENGVAGAALHSYLGIPLFNDADQLICVASVFGGPNREFNEEDEWWLRAASQPLSDELARRLLETKVQELEQALMRGSDNSAGEAADKKGAASKKTILVVDDDRTVNDVLCEYLSMEGYHAEAAFDGLEAMRKFRPAEHVAVMTDVAMPLMNGWELIAALRVRAPELPVVLITGYGSGNWNENYLRKNGVCAVLSKPLDLTRLAEILEEITTAKNQLVA